MFRLGLPFARLPRLAGLERLVAGEHLSVRLSSSRAWRCGRPGEWCLLGLCVGAVIGAELLNTALEQLAQAIDREHNPQIGAALDMSAAGVLVVALAAAVVGAAVFLNRLGILLSWWPT
jgi:hypothetical protein